MAKLNAHEKNPDVCSVFLIGVSAQINCKLKFNIQINFNNQLLFILIQNLIMYYSFYHSQLSFLF